MFSTRIAAAALLLAAASLASAATPAPPLVLGPYKYDGTGNVKQMGEERFTYDALGRITYGTSQINRAQRYTYDGFGNLTKIATTGMPDLFVDVNSANNQLSNVPRQTGMSGTYVYGGKYDAAGNQQQLNGGDGGRYEFDPLNTATGTTSGTAHRYYLYDADDERVAVVDYADATHTSWKYAVRSLAGDVIRELHDDVSGTGHQWRWQKDYVYGGPRVLASLRPDGASVATTHFHVDHVFSPILLTDGAGLRLSLRKYFAYGVESTQSQDGERLSFSGHERDADGTANALDYVHARYYLATVGRFLSIDPGKADPKSPLSWNSYLYALGNPLKYIDPSGETVDLSQLTPEELDKLLKGLYQFTGNTYERDGNGKLALVSVGWDSSASATKTLSDAISSSTNYLVVPTNKDTRWNREEQRVEINFHKLDHADFHGINPATFTYGTSLVHELLHGMQNLEDFPGQEKGTGTPPPFGVTGPVEELVNMMREERGLPRRESYTGEGQLNGTYNMRFDHVNRKHPKRLRRITGLKE